MATTHLSVTQPTTNSDQRGGDIRDLVTQREALLKSHLLDLSKQAGFAIANDHWVPPKEFTRRSLGRSLLHMLHTVEILLVITGIYGLSYAVFVLLDHFAG
jgi:hypothetical protein